MIRHRLLLAALVASSALVPAVALSSSPAFFTYQGVLRDAEGRAVTTASTLRFRFYDAAVGGSQVGATEELVVTPGSDGSFSVLVGSGLAGFGALFDQPLFLGVEVDGDGQEMSPRMALGSSPYALAVDWAGVKGFPASGCSGATPFVTGLSASGAVVCSAQPAGAGGCGSGQSLVWNGTAWACKGGPVCTQRTNTLAIGAKATVNMRSSCALGETITGGGYYVGTGVSITHSYPGLSGAGVTVPNWTVEGTNAGTSSVDVTVYAICCKF